MTMANAAEVACELGETRAGRDARARAPPDRHKKKSTPLGRAGRKLSKQKHNRGASYPMDRFSLQGILLATVQSNICTLGG
jgi:hypothetical protein